MTLLLSAAPTTLTEPAPKADSENPVQDGGHATGKGEGKEKNGHTSWEDTLGSRKERVLGKPTRVRSLWRNTEN